MNKDIKALRERLQQLKAQHDKGTIGRKAFESGKAQLEREILQAVLASPEAATPRPAEAPTPRRAAVARHDGRSAVLRGGAGGGRLCLDRVAGRAERRAAVGRGRDERRQSACRRRQPRRRSSPRPSRSWPNG